MKAKIMIMMMVSKPILKTQKLMVNIINNLYLESTFIGKNLNVEEVNLIYNCYEITEIQNSIKAAIKEKQEILINNIL